MVEIKNIGGSVFWILLIMLSLGGLTYLGIWSFFNNSVKGVMMCLIFFIMISAGILLSKFEIFNSGSWSENCFAFALGSAIWLVISLNTQSVTAFSILSVTKNSLLATISSELPEVLEFTMNSFVIPIAEEAFWLIGIPYALLTMMDVAAQNSKSLRFLKNELVKVVMIVIVTGISFAAFHVGKAFLGFLIGAFIFRTILVVTVWGDTLVNAIPFVTLVPAFAVGAHVGNNFGTYGLQRGLMLLTQNAAIGWLVGGVLVFIFLSALNQLVLWIVGAKGTVIGESA